MSLKRKLILFLVFDPNLIFIRKINKPFIIVVLQSIQFCRYVIKFLLSRHRLFYTYIFVCRINSRKLCIQNFFKLTCMNFLRVVNFYHIRDFIFSYFLCFFSRLFTYFLFFIYYRTYCLFFWFCPLQIFSHDTLRR